MDYQQQPMPTCSESPLFVPERVRSPRVVISSAGMNGTTTPTRSAAVDTESKGESFVEPFILRLQAYEASARSKITSWDQQSKSATGTCTIPSKRKAADLSLGDDEDDDADDDDDDDESSEVLPYDPAKQEPPKLPIYHPGFALTEKLGKEILSAFLDFLKAANLRGIADSEANFLWNEILKKRVIEYQAEIRIAITGDTGSGKSATTNSFLGVDGLTPEGADGGACTNVVTEFRRKLMDQTAPVVAQVQFYCVEYCVNLVTNWYNHWVAIRKRQMKDEEDISDDDKAQKDAAFECLDALFAYRAPSDCLEEFMIAKRSSGDRDILGKLVEWTREIHTKFIQAGEMSITFTSSTHHDMREQLRPFRGSAANAMFKGKRLLFSPWPFVEIIRYYLSNPLLDQGNCIADVPGAKDVNMYRVSMANEYLQKCEMAIIVGDIKRIKSDSSFRHHYMEAHRRRYHGSVILYATRSDELNDDGETVSQLDATAEQQLARIEEKLSDLEIAVAGINSEIDANKSGIKTMQAEIKHMLSASQSHNAAVKREALKSMREVTKTLKASKAVLEPRTMALENERSQVRIACRNRQVAEAMVLKYRADTGDDGGAAAFCASNRMYMRHRRGYNKNKVAMAPTMTVEETQVPAACAFIYGIPSQGKTDVLEHFITSRIPMLLNIIQMSCSKSTETRVNHILGIVDDAIKIMAAKIETLALKARETFVKVLVDKLADHELQDRFDKNALAKLEPLSKLHASTHKALVNKYGTYTQKKKNISINLNEEFMSLIRPHLDQPFRLVLDEACQTFKAEAAQTIKTIFRNLSARLRDDPQALAGDAYQLCFGKNLETYERDITRNVDLAANKLRERFVDLHQKATRTRDNDFLPDAMLEVYELALKQPATRGKTIKDVRQQYLIDNIIGPNGPFQWVANWTHEDARASIREARNSLVMESTKMLHGIRVAFERQKHNKENDTPEGKQFRKDLHLLVAEARRVLDGVVKESFTRCKENK